MLGGFSLSVFGYLLAIVYIRRRDGIQPSYAGLVVMCISMGGFLLVFWVLRRFGVDLLRRGSRDIFWLVLSFVWLGLAVWMVHERHSSGALLMDLGPSPSVKLHLVCGVLMAAVAIPCALNPDTRAQGIAYHHMVGMVFRHGTRPFRSTRPRSDGRELFAVEPHLRVCGHSRRPGSLDAQPGHSANCRLQTPAGPARRFHPDR